MGRGKLMTCKHCNQPIIVNQVRRSREPFVYHKYKHQFGNLIGCFDSTGNKLGTIAEAKEG